MIKEVTFDMISAHNKALESAKGTPAYGNYLMACECKSNYGFTFIGYSVPFSYDFSKINAYIKIIKGKAYLYINTASDGVYRYYIDDFVKEFYNL